MTIVMKMDGVERDLWVFIRFNPTPVTQPPKAWNRTLIFIALPFLLYGLFSVVMGGAYVLAVVGGGYLDDTTLYASSPAEARAADVYLDTVVVEPRVVRYGDYAVTFKTCWLQQLRTSHRPAWYAQRVESTQPRVLFILNYRATYRGRPVVDSENAPILSYVNGGGGNNISQEAEQHLAIYADLGPDTSLSEELPLRLALDDGPGQLPTRMLTAYPLRAKQWVDSLKAHPNQPKTWQ